MKPDPHYLIDLARQFRKHATPAEKLLWEKLRNRRLSGYKFVRQIRKGQYIVDFCCREEKLIVEVEGGIHERSGQKEYDATRFEELDVRGFRVLRFSNDEVMNNIDNVLDRILQELNS